MRALAFAPVLVVMISCAAGGSTPVGTGAGTTASSTTSGNGGAGGVAGNASSSSGIGGGGGPSGSTNASSSTTTSATSASSSGTSASSSTSAASSSSAASSTSAASSSSASSSSSSSTSASSSSGSTGPVDIGLYTYTAVPAYGLLNPPAAAWHPGGAYALVLNTSDTVFKYDPVTHALTQVGSAGTTVTWRAIAFAPGGAKAVLLGNVASPAEARVYLWDDASATLTQMTTETFAGGTYEGIAWSGDGTKAELLGAKANAGAYIAYLWSFDVTAGRSNVKAQATSAGCQDLAWATDAFGAPAIAVTCGVNGVSLFHVDGGGNFVNYTGNAGNTSRISARPQGDYALAIGWSAQSVSRFQEGAWTTAFGDPTYPGIFTVGFSSDGRRALILGSAGGSPLVGRAVEFRHDLYTQTQITDVSIPNFGLAPYNASSSASLNDVAWRPGCDGGIIVGGTNTFSAQQAFVIRFSVDNGVLCAN